MMRDYMERLSKRECFDFVHSAGQEVFSYIIPSELTDSNMLTLFNFAGVAPPLFLGRKKFITLSAEIYGAYIISIAYFVPLSLIREKEKNDEIDESTVAYVKDIVVEELRKFESRIYLDRVRRLLFETSFDVVYIPKAEEETLSRLTYSMGRFALDGIRDQARIRNLQISPELSEVNLLIVQSLFAGYLQKTFKLLGML